MCPHIYIDWFTSIVLLNTMPMWRQSKCKLVSINSCDIFIIVYSVMDDMMQTMSPSSYRVAYWYGRTMKTPPSCHKIISSLGNIMIINIHTNIVHWNLFFLKRIEYSQVKLPNASAESRVKFPKEWLAFSSIHRHRFVLFSHAQGYMVLDKVFTVDAIFGVICEHLVDYYIALGVWKQNKSVTVNRGKG